MRRSFKIAMWSTFMMAMLQSCSNRTGQSPINDYCMLAKPIYISSGDQLTDPTARQILDHDQTGHKLCNWPESR